MTKAEQRICLRALEPSDIEFLYQWENDSRYWLESQTLQPYSKSLLNDFLEESSRFDIFHQRQLRLVVETLSEREMIGFVDLFDIDFVNSRAAVGILINPLWQRKGFGTQAIALLKEYAFTHLNLYQLYAHIIENNIFSKQLFIKNDFERIAILKHWVQTERMFRDVELYQILNYEETI